MILATCGESNSILHKIVEYINYTIHSIGYINLILTDSTESEVSVASTFSLLHTVEH